MPNEPFRPVDYFTVLARVRQLLPQGKGVLGHEALVRPDTIADAARLCGLTTEWVHFAPESVADLRGLLGDVEGTVYVVGDSSVHADVTAFEVGLDALETLPERVCLFGSDVVLVATSAPVLALAHHESMSMTVFCQPAHIAAEDPVQLEALLRRSLEERRERVLSQMSPALVTRLERLPGQGANKVAAMKLLRDETGCSLVDAGTTVALLRPWWPSAGVTDEHGAAGPRLGRRQAW